MAILLCVYATLARENENVAPAPGAPRASTLPPCRSTISLTMARPILVPSNSLADLANERWALTESVLQPYQLPYIESIRRSLGGRDINELPSSPSRFPA